MAGSELQVDQAACGECGLCVAVCSYDAIFLRSSRLEILKAECVLCDVCVEACPTDALSIG
jgi:ferredoxin